MYARTFLFAISLAAAFCLSGRPATAEAIVFRISTENAADHVQTRAVARFAAELARRAGGRLAVSHHSGAELFRDRDVIKALRQGKVEMAVPGTWQLDRLEPSVGIFLLPAFYGRDAQERNRLRDGEIGREINSRLEDNLGVKVPGRWIDLGFTHIFGVRRRIDDYRDLASLRIRVAGGEANLHRLTSLGAQPRVIPWPDLPQAMADGTVDGLLTSHETVASARLWEKGVTSAFEDRQYFAEYIPMVAAGFWARLPRDMQEIVAGAWEDSVAWARQEAAAAQAAARETLQANGVRIVRPDPAAQAAKRKELLAVQDATIAAMGIDPTLAARAIAVFAKDP